jgi:hypothetical protein
VRALAALIVDGNNGTAVDLDQVDAGDPRL